MGDILLRTLFEVSGLAFEPGDFAAADVQREIITPSGKFIDLLVTTRSFIAAVENKIDAPLYNDLVEYSDYVDACAHGRRTAKIILCLSTAEPCLPFVSVTYKTLFARLRSNLESNKLKSTTNRQYLGYLHDTMNTIDELNKIKQTDKVFRRFVTKHEVATIALVDRITAMKDEFHDKVRQLEKLIQGKPIRKGIHVSLTDEKQIYESLWLEFRAKSKAPITLEAWISAAGWQVETYRATDAARKLTTKQFDYETPIQQLAEYSQETIETIKRKS